MTDSAEQFDQAAPDPDPDPELVDLVAACLEEVEKEGSAALEAFCVRHPEHAGELRRVVAELSASGMLRTADREGAEVFPDRLGEFHLLERIGVGGMGVVYRAEQGSLRRQVALKLIRPDYLYFPGARQRLQREVEAVARLDHPGLVSVLTVGEDGGIPYFAMEFVNGCSVAQALREVEGKDPKTLTGADLRNTVVRLCPDPAIQGDAFGCPHLYQGTWTQACTRIARMAAEALDHAHSRGIIHRDIKPSNIMLTPGGRVLVVDFGLAMLQAGPRLTRTGSTLGSVAYMAPEQVRGDAQDEGIDEGIDERIDVYSLGVTLYEMLTLEHAFEGKDVHAIQAKILHGRIERPRSRNAAVGRDLETVCLAAMDRDRGRRYRTCGDLARDLTNLLELRPVLARRPGPLLRSARWVQRHKAATAVLVAAVLIPLLILFQQMSANRKINLALHQAEENFDTALAAVDRLLGRMSHSKLRHMPQMTEVRSEMLRDTFEFCMTLLGKEPENIAVLRRAAFTASSLGRLLMLRGKRDEAGDAYETAMGLYDKLVGLSSTDRLTPVGKVCDYAAAAVDLGNLQRALELCDKAERWCGRFRPEDNENGKADALRALINRQRSLAYHFLKQHEERDAALQQCIADMENIAREHPAFTNHRYELGKCHILQGNHLRPERPQAAQASYVRARELLEVVVQEMPRHEDAHASLGRAINSHASVLVAISNWEEMERVSRQAVEIFEALTRDFPQIQDFASNLGAAYHNLAVALTNQRRHQEAADAIAKAIAAQDRAYQQRTDSARFAGALANHYYLQGMVCMRLEDPAGVHEATLHMVRVQPTTANRIQALGLLATCVDMVEQARLKELYASAAEDQLEAAIQTGFRDAEALRVLGSLRDRPRFRRIVTRLRELQKAGR